MDNDDGWDSLEVKTTAEDLSVSGYRLCEVILLFSGRESSAVSAAASIARQLVRRFPQLCDA